MVNSHHNKRVYRAIPINHMLNNRGKKENNLNVKLNQELLESYRNICLSQEEILSRNEVFNMFKNIIESEFNCIVESYGSYRTNLMVHASDLDITILTNGPHNSKNNDACTEESKGTINKYLQDVINVLEKKNITSGPIMHIKNARIPIIKCKDAKYNYKIDISLNKYDAIDSAEFVKQQLEEREYLKYFIILTKYFLKRRQLSETIRGGLCAYAQFLLILNFIQLHPLIQSNEIVVEENLGTLFMDFFQFYGSEFPFEKSTISVLEVRYKPNRDSQINIEDPINPGHNVAWGCNSLHMIREIFNYSYKLMSAAFASKVPTNKAIGELWLRMDGKEAISRKKFKKEENSYAN